MLTDDLTHAIHNKNYAAISGEIAAEKQAAKNKTLLEKMAKQLARLQTNENKEQVLTGAIAISTFKNGNAPMTAPNVLDGCLRLTVKQATIVALHIMEGFTNVAMANGMVILTPLAGAIFPRDSIEKLWDNHVIKEKFESQHKLIDSINKSAQNGGQFLANSRTDVTAICTIVGTLNIKKQEERRNIVQRAVKQYAAHNRPADKEVFNALVEYATGGVAVEWTYEILSQEYTTRVNMLALQRSAREAQVAVKRDGMAVASTSSKN